MQNMPPSPHIHAHTHLNHRWGDCAKFLPSFSPCWGCRNAGVLRSQPIYDLSRDTIDFTHHVNAHEGRGPVCQTKKTPEKRFDRLSIGPFEPRGASGALRRTLGNYFCPDK